MWTDTRSILSIPWPENHWGFSSHFLDERREKGSRERVVEMVAFGNYGDRSVGKSLPCNHELLSSLLRTGHGAHLPSPAPWGYMQEDQKFRVILGYVGS